MTKTEPFLSATYYFSSLYFVSIGNTLLLLLIYYSRILLLISLSLVYISSSSFKCKHIPSTAFYIKEVYFQVVVHSLRATYLADFNQKIL